MKITTLLLNILHPTYWLRNIFSDGIQDKSPSKYNNHTELVKRIQEINYKCSDVSSVYTIGKSSQGRDLVVLEFTNNPGRHHIGRVETFYLSGIHGNEPVGKEILLLFAMDICTKYRNEDLEIIQLFAATRIHLLFSMNPDGFEMAEKTCLGGVGRTNANNVDLNRNFPYEKYTPTDPIQPETVAVMLWLEYIPFTLSAAFHGGEKVISYPFDGSYEFQRKYTKTTEDSVFIHLSNSYAQNHLSMSVGSGCQGLFQGGIVNGAEWYPLMGSLQDHIYYKTNGLDITAEISCCKYPDDSELLPIYEENKISLIQFLKEANRGVKGIINGPDKKPLKQALIVIEELGKPVSTTKYGEYWKILLPGTYHMCVYPPDVLKSSISPKNFTFIVHDHYKPTILNMPPFYSILEAKQSCCKMGILPLNTKFKGPAPVGDGSADIIDEAMNFFRANIFFKQYDVKNTVDRTIIYLTLYITECLKRVVKCNDKNEMIKELTSLATTKFDIPGDAGFPLNAYYGKPVDASEAEQCRSYIAQLRQECSARMVDKLLDQGTGKPSKWWICFSKRKFLDKSLAPIGK